MNYEAIVESIEEATNRLAPVWMSRSARIYVFWERRGLCALASIRIMRDGCDQYDIPFGMVMAKKDRSSIKWAMFIHGQNDLNPELFKHIGEAVEAVESRAIVKEMMK